MKLARALTAYSPICAEISIPLRNRLDQLQKEFNLFLKGEKSNQDHVIEDTAVSTLEFESRVVDIPPVSSRAGLYIYVNSLVCCLLGPRILLNYTTRLAIARRATFDR